MDIILLLEENKLEKSVKNGTADAFCILGAAGVLCLREWENKCSFKTKFLLDYVVSF